MTTRLAGLTFLGLLAAGPLMAGLAPQDTGSPLEAELSLLRQQITGIEGFIPLPPAPQTRCDPQAKGVTRGLFVAPTNWGAPEMSRHQSDSTQNDVAMLRNAFIGRGASAAQLQLLTGDAATHDGVAQALTDLANATNCGDSVVLHFSGWSFGPDLIGAAHEAGGPFSGARKEATLQSLGSAYMAPWTDADWIIAAGPFFLLQASASDHGDVLSAAALSQVVTQLRNRGADVTVILDTISSEAFALEDRQARVDIAETWRHRLDPADAAPRPETATPTTLNPDAGAFSVLYGTERGNEGQIRNLPRGAKDRKPYGVFSFFLASALLQADRPTLPGLLRQMEQANPDFRQSLIFAATNPDHDLIVENRPDTPPQNGSIRILNPEPSRSAAPLDVSQLRLEGRVEAAADTMIVTVNGAVATSAPDGSFALDVELQAGVNRFDILALTRDDQPLTHSFELFYEGDMQALAGDGTRYALIIANQSYGAGSGLATLATPLGDAQAVADVLMQRFGYVTTAKRADGSPIDLFLKDATRVQIETALFELGQIAGAKDSVLIFYAGHGIYEQATDGAFWLPADASADRPFTWLPAAAISDAILRIEAGNVLVISDSCYSGALLRGNDVTPTAVDDADRLRSLQRLASKRSRIVIASGGNEPVADGGGDGHSVFARALIQGLSEMPQEAFTARELFDQYLLPMVTARAAQEPQYRPIERSGHEGGDVVLVRAEASDL